MAYRYPEYYPPQAPYMYWDYPTKKEVDLAEAYIPYQRYTTSLSPMEALRAGTMFPELVKPYQPNDYKGVI